MIPVTFWDTFRVMSATTLLIILMVVWIIFYIKALYVSARNKQWVWFVFMFFIPILAIIYLIFVRHKK